MAKKETVNQPKDLIEVTPEELDILNKEEFYEKLEVISTKDTADEPVIIPKDLSEEDERAREAVKSSLASWIPKTKLGKLVREGKEKNLQKILDTGKKILEPEIVDSLLHLETILLSIGQAKGKFGGGKRRAWRQTQKKTMEGNVVSFSAMAVVGNRQGFIGIGFGKAAETLPSREKAFRNAKLNITKINLGFESPENELNKNDPHTVPFKVQGKCGSVRITLWPAPRGTGLVASDECKKILRLAGVKDVYSKILGNSRTTFNLAKAALDALEKTRKIQ